VRSRQRRISPGWRQRTGCAGFGRARAQIINKINTNTVEITSIRIYARALQSSVEIARLGPAARNDALTIRTADAHPLSAATRAPRHLTVPRGLPVSSRAATILARRMGKAPSDHSPEGMAERSVHNEMHYPSRDLSYCFLYRQPPTSSKSVPAKH
jgi:hypothetical protein